MSTFELDRYTFDLPPLKVKQSMQGMRVIGAAIGPLVAAAAAEDGATDGGKLDGVQTVGKLLAGLEGVDELYKLFLNQCKVTVEGEPRAEPLKHCADQVFERRPTLLLAWLVECVKLEYADFLTESGQALLKSTGLGSTSRRTSAGRSGG